MIRAFYTTRNGAGCVRPINTLQEAERILQGAYNAMTVRLEDDNATDPDCRIVGERLNCADYGYIFEDKRIKWYWWLDTSAFNIK